ncbi:MAG: hypothetical protein MJ198_08400 [Bacteroidales bacterium]|nr:hypothetical protein [Bacteroidales bacterium]
MATVNLFFDKRHTNKSGLIPILYKLSHKNQMTTWTTGYSARECEYNGDDNAFLNRKNPKHKSINSELYQNLLNYRKLISENISTIKDMLVVELKNFILYGKKSEPIRTDFFEYAEEYINIYSGGTKKCTLMIKTMCFI